MRLLPVHSGRIKRVAKVRFTFDGAPVDGYAGESVAAALWRSGRLSLRSAPADGAPRGAVCCMGLCQECLVLLDGQRVESCRLTVREGLDLQRIGEAS